MPTWNNPKNWQTGEALTASDMNTYISDNLSVLKAPPTEHYECNETTDYTTTSTTGFVDVDATNLVLTITTAGGDVLIGFAGSVENNTAAKLVYFDVDLDGVRVAANDGICFVRTDAVNSAYNASFCYLVTGLSAASHTFKLQWKVSGGTAKMYAGSGAAGADMHPQFWVREV